MSEVNKHAERLRDAAKSLAFLKMPRRASDCDSAAAEIERLSARVAELERQWLPIESAPRDGTRVELWESGRASYAAFVNGFWCSDNDFDFDPTHWRPEPDGPKK